MKGFRISHVVHIGPRKVTRHSTGHPVIYLPKRDFQWLIGKKVLITLEVIETDDGTEN